MYTGGLPTHSNVRTLHVNDPQYENTTPWRFTLDLRIDKTIKLGENGSITFYTYVQNLLNRKNINHVHWKTGNTVDDGSSDFLDGARERVWFKDFYTLYQLINLNHRQHYRTEEGGDLFGRPREIRFGISFNY